jgi:hypothetical protein
MPPRNRGHDDGPPSRPHGRGGGSGRPPNSVREAQDDVAEEILAGRSTENGGTAGNRIERPASPRPQTEDLLTHRSGEPGGTPQGDPTTIERGEDAEVHRSLEMENAGAAVLADRGYRIQQNPTKAEVAQARSDAGDVGDPGKDPDYLLEGRVFDCYSPVNPDKAVRGIWTQAKIKVDDGQTQRVVVNLDDWRGDMSALRKQFADWPIPGLKEVKAITRDGDIVQIDLPPHQPMEVYPWLSNTD